MQFDDSGMVANEIGAYSAACPLCWAKGRLQSETVDARPPSSSKGHEEDVLRSTRRRRPESIGSVDLGKSNDDKFVLTNKLKRAWANGETNSR